MNKNIDLTKILKDCPKGTKFYSILYGQVEFISVNPKNDSCQIVLKELRRNSITFVDSKGKYFHDCDGECTLFPSKNQRDWSKFSALWYKKKFDPKILKPFDKVLMRDFSWEKWNCQFFSHIINANHPYAAVYGVYKMCIPYNDETKHLVGTNEEAPKYYKYWKD